ncbi:MAG: aminoacetone oxidase family FAD-binding enzyme [Ruminococcus flavefaciens]|nr:aminoacetone oxidase family FAD-binding enzyme [Ruminococcus flavefaciens]
MYTDIAVIGGGASGYASAITSARLSGAEVTIIERLFRTGKKITATGNGKCNLSNKSLRPENYHGSVDAMKIINSTPDWYEFFTEGMGVMCVSGSEGREGGIYPRSNTATTVLNALRLTAQSLGVKEVCDTEIQGILQRNGRYVLKTKDSEIICRKIIIACGGYAGTSFGTDGLMIRILKDMGYKTSKICPAVAPLRVSPENLKGLKGVRVKGRISAVSGGKVLRTEYGEMQFNENNISGICVFNLSYLFQQYEGKLTLRADLMPDMEKADIKAYLEKIRRMKAEYAIEELLTGIFVKNLAVYLVKKVLRRPLDDKINTLTDSEIKKLARVIKCLEFEVTGCSSWQNAQATCGGIHAECITENLESRLHRGIYFCGEILDTVGDCGGYNLQWAWSSGIWAGMKCAESLKGGKNVKNK